jgi:hypothetical protein
MSRDSLWIVNFICRGGGRGYNLMCPLIKTLRWFIKICIFPYIMKYILWISVVAKVSLFLNLQNFDFGLF